MRLEGDHSLWFPLRSAEYTVQLRSISIKVLISQYDKNRNDMHDLSIANTMPPSSLLDALRLRESEIRHVYGTKITV